MKVFTSKINWVGIITVLIGTLTSMQQLNLSPQTMSYVVTGIGFLTIVLRTFFSSPLSNDTQVLD